jgi:hypothetical protein
MVRERRGAVVVHLHHPYFDAAPGALARTSAVSPDAGFGDLDLRMGGCGRLHGGQHRRDLGGVIVDVAGELELKQCGVPVRGDWLALAPLSGDRTWVTRPVIWIRASTSRSVPIRFPRRPPEGFRARCPATSSTTT